MTATPIAAAPAAQPTDGLPPPRRYWALVVIWLVISMVVLDGTIANVALPTIARDLGADASRSIWVINAYQLAIATALLPLAALGEKLGYRRINLAGVAIFTAASLACAFAPSLDTLVAARVIQGLGGACIMATNTAILRFVVPQRLLGRTIGYNSVFIALAASAGPAMASLILAAGSWRWLFAINAPIGILTLVIGLRSLPRTEGQHRPFDLISTVLNAVAFGLLVLGAESLTREGMAHGLWKIAVGAVAAVLLIRRELRRPNPLVPFDLLRIPLFGLSILTSTLAFISQMMALVALPFYFQTVLGFGVVETGLLMTPWPLAVGVAAPVAGHLADRYPAGVLGAFGLAILTAGLASLALLHPGTQARDIIWSMAACGVGFGFFQSPNNRVIISSGPRERSGAASGMLSTARILGQTIGALAVAVIFDLMGVGGAPLALGLGAGIASLAMLVSLMRPRTMRRQSASGEG